jgi:hypothetical protein
MVAFPALFPPPLQAHIRQSPFSFSRTVPEGVSVSADGLVVSNVTTRPGCKLRSALMEPVFSSAERYYAEWVIEEDDSDVIYKRSLFGTGASRVINIGVTDLDSAPPAGQNLYLPGSRMYSCFDSTAFPNRQGYSGGRDWGATGQRALGDRVGLLVERGSLSVYVNGAQLGPGPMATDLPERVRDTTRAGSRYQLAVSCGPAHSFFRPFPSAENLHLPTPSLHPLTNCPVRLSRSSAH